MQKISPMLWFDKEAEEAATFYVSVFKNSKIETVLRYDDATAKAAHMPAGTVFTVSFQLEGQEFTALNGGPVFKFSEAISFVITCKDQAEIDYYWENLSAVSPSEQCGWLKDKFGVSWQVVPENLVETITKNPAASAALMKMKKIIIADLENAK